MCTHNGKQGKPRVNKEINIGVLTTLLTTASSLLTGWMTNKKEKQEQVHAKEMEKIKNTNDWEITHRLKGVLTVSKMNTGQSYSQSH